MNNKKYSLPNQLPIDRELLAKSIYDANFYLGELKSRVHYLEKYSKILIAKLFRANAMVLQISHHQDDLRQERSLDRVKLDKGIYDVT